MSLSKLPARAASAAIADPVATVYTWLSWPFALLRDVDRAILASLGFESSRSWDVVGVSVGLATVLLLSRSIASSYRRSKVQKEMRERAQRKRQQRDEKLSPTGSESKALDLAAAKVGLDKDRQRRTNIVSKSVPELLEALRERKLTSEEIVVAFCLQSRELCGPKSTINALAETCFEEAIEQARDSDKRRQAAMSAGVGEQSDAALAIIRPLEGLPISIKDHLDQIGYDSTLGLACRTFRPLEEDSVVVKLLREAGAIIFTRTNAPQSLAMNETVNHIWGRTANPWDPSGERSPGGSSGGEGALVASRGSPIGIGSDIGGSIRLPSNACGIYGFKPTPARISLRGVTSPYCDTSSKIQFASEGIRAVCGPMSDSVEGLILVLHAWLGEQSAMWKYDPYIPKVPFRESVVRSTAPLKIGYFVDNGYLTPSASVIRAVNEAKATLEKAGHILVPFSPPPPKDCMEAYLGLLWGHGGSLGLQLGLQGEEPHAGYKLLIPLTTLVARYGRVAGLLLETIFSLLGEKRSAEVVHWLRRLSVFEYEQNVATKQHLQELYTRQWQAAGIDALICPVFPYPALIKDAGNLITSGVSCTSVWNLLHYPAGTAPITTSRPHEDDNWVPKKEDGISFLTNVIKDSLKNNQSLPVGVQVVALPFEDEICLRVMKDLETYVHFNQTPPEVLAP